tara:strand:+ start:61 stop:657 length:597 start_codon:yes stop_codon:yes gene_type:complete
MSFERSKNQTESSGWIEVICGSMFSGKTEELIRRIKRAKLAKQKIKLFKPTKDTRFKKKKIVSHDASSIKSKTVKSAQKILKFSNDAQVIGIDEAQFFDDKIVKVCNDLANAGKRVIVAGLDMDYKGNPFGPMPNLLAVAEYITKVHAVCTKTGKMANYSHRIINNEDLIVLGDTAKYEALSRKEFNRLNNLSKFKKD